MGCQPRMVRVVGRRKDVTKAREDVTQEMHCVTTLVSLCNAVTNHSSRPGTSLKGLHLGLVHNRENRGEMYLLTSLLAPFAIGEGLYPRELNVPKLVGCSIWPLGGSQEGRSHVQTVVLHTTSKVKQQLGTDESPT